MRDIIGQRGRGLIIDHYISHTGDDIAILMTHTRGVDNSDVHRLAWDAFLAGTATAKEQGLTQTRPEPRLREKCSAARRPTKVACHS